MLSSKRIAGHDESDEDDEEILKLKLEEIQTRLRLKKLQKLKAKEQRNSTTENNLTRDGTLMVTEAQTAPRGSWINPIKLEDHDENMEEEGLDSTVSALHSMHGLQVVITEKESLRKSLIERPINEEDPENGIIDEDIVQQEPMIFTRAIGSHHTGNGDHKHKDGDSSTSSREKRSRDTHPESNESESDASDEDMYSGNESVEANATPRLATSISNGQPSDEPFSATLSQPVRQIEVSTSNSPPIPDPNRSDTLEYNLLVAFIGMSPGEETARLGTLYADHSNTFWKLLYSSGCTNRLYRPDEFRRLRELSLGHSTVAQRATNKNDKLQTREKDAGVRILERKIKSFKPEVVCLVGKDVWKAIFHFRNGRHWNSEKDPPIPWDWQPEIDNFGAEVGGWRGARVFLAESTSGANSVGTEVKERNWKKLGDWVIRRRRERVAVVAAPAPM
jgi:G:T/U-mismatch repair DNA glycosylase